MYCGACSMYCGACSMYCGVYLLHLSAASFVVKHHIWCPELIITANIVLRITHNKILK